ncbi:MAG: hypothetical protein JWO09_1226 [Bacteroidetes bacterium]|nr:hypothetical protein [Bacteroidota bacterium]
MLTIKETEFYSFLSEGIGKGGFTNDDVVAVIMPLLEEVHSFHLSGKVAPLDKLSSILVTNEKLDIDESLAGSPCNNVDKVTAILPKKNEVFEISGHLKQSTEIGEYNSTEVKNREIQSDANADILMPVYLPNYKCYEVSLGHHDAATDIYILGMILASLALGLDFTQEDDLAGFAENRGSMIFLNHKIHPSIANIIFGMTELDRRKRWKDLGEIIDNLKNYRDYNPETEHDLATIANAKNKDKSNRQHYIQGKLRNRLFDISRRNRLLYFKPNLKFLNLSVSSVPAVLNYKNIDPESLFFWNRDVSEKVIKGKDISLSKYIRFEDNPYIAPSLDKIRLEANRDVNEYGFSQLKLVISFLNWYNTKEQTTEKICSPLILVPVNLVKKKGVKDQYILEIVDNEAEINPVLSFMLKDLYDIRLPESIQLSESSLDELFRNLKTQIEKARSGIVLEMINKPKIKLIHAQARQTLSQYKRRVNRNRKVQTFHNLDYSYNADNFQPLGLQLFRNYVKPEHSSLEFLINSDIKANPSYFSDSSMSETTRELYQLDGGNTNPFKWEFDTCNMVLGNFNYKKMSLVRDYNSIIDENIQSSVFESLFSSLPKKARPEQETESRIEEQFNVIQSDPTQNKSVIYSRKGESYIIQGPPGTGKSQTISNLIADYVARGKKVLFVCEKRAAIDVVYYRLKQQQLDQLCCLIHDSQTDKKEFIQNLKATFGTFTTKPLSAKEAEKERNAIVAQINSELSVIKEFHSSMQHYLDHAQLKIRELMEVLIQSKQHIPEGKEIPGSIGYKDWLAYGGLIQKISRTSNELEGSPFYSKHPFRYLGEKAIYNEKPGTELKAELIRSMELVGEIAERLEMADVPESCIGSITALREFLEQVEMLLPFKEQDRAGLLTVNSELHKKLSDAVTNLETMHAKVEEAAGKNKFWLQKFSETDAENALEIVQKHERSFFSFFNSSFRKIKKAIHQSYNFSMHQVKPPLTQVVSNLKAEYDVRNSFNKEKQSTEQFFRLGDLFSLAKKLKEIEPRSGTPAFAYVKNEETGLGKLKDLAEIRILFGQLDASLQENLRDTSRQTLESLSEIMQAIIARTKDLSAFAPLMRELNSADAALKQIVLEENLLPSQVKGLLAKASIDKFYSTNRDARKIEGEKILHQVAKIKKLYQKFLAVNSGYIIAKQQERFNKLIQKSEMSMAGKSNQEKEEKRSLVEGRKILDNEFGKSMRYKSIREMATSESGQIIRELKPVWLMSPLSVSDTLPLRTDYFDVVIFDEASQITLEEGVPPVYRASQIIIVGDEMQMPPSNYFSSSSSDPDDLWEEDDEDSKLLSLDADSFLTQGARKFPSVMLGWHYRSRHESLIGFSNASFYKNELLTIPDNLDNQNELNEITAENKNDAVTNAAALLERPISYHFLKHGVYESRSNIAEAEYIAEMIRTLLLQKKGLSIGVVAFSMEQQGEIESAVTNLAREDKEFEKAIEEEYKRMEDNQFVGIFFKNLENVQGDERDIIIMSTCYGYDPKGKMIMNFGPINRRGGEKRLNVIFSRAKKRMCVVSSIKYTDIKNEYNEGANYFRKYLQYAEHASKGNMEMANLVLQSVIAEEKKIKQELYNTVVIGQLVKMLEDNGYSTTKLIGQSYFKCHIGVKRSASDTSYTAGILVDDMFHYSNSDLLEQYLFKPEILRSSGWKVMQVYSKDWYDDPDKLTKRILGFIESDALAEPRDEAPEEETGFTEEQPNDETFPESPAEEAGDDNSLSTGAVRLLNSENNSNKFWEIHAEENNLVIRYGKAGTKGQRIIKSFDTKAMAENEMQKLIRQKLAKGYKASEG